MSIPEKLREILKQDGVVAIATLGDLPLGFGTVTRSERRVRALAVPTEVLRLTQPIDTDRFRPLRPLPERPTMPTSRGRNISCPHTTATATGAARR